MAINIERVPWWGGMFEHMIGSTKRFLRKMIGQSKLSYDELNTMVIEVKSNYQLLSNQLLIN